MAVSACDGDKAPGASLEINALQRGPFAVGSTNMEVAPEYSDLSEEMMFGYLTGGADESGVPRELTEILAHPESAWVTDVSVPNVPEVYGPAAGETLPVVTYLTFPTAPRSQPNRYAFPYHDARYGIFEDMLAAGDSPIFADPDARYPLIIMAHGMDAHSIYDVRHAHNLSSHGFIVAVITYGDARTAIPDDPNHHVSFLRPLLTKAVLDSILESEAFGAHIDVDNIGITGHSYGGFTALAIAGAPIQGNAATVTDERITAAVIAAPWVGGPAELYGEFAFGPDNQGLNRVSVPVISFIGTNDDVTPASTIMPAMKQLSGPTYVVELVDQPHVFEQGSWEDRDAWELVFFSAYLKQDQDALKLLETAHSAEGGNEDRQLFDYQQVSGKD